MAKSGPGISIISKLRGPQVPKPTREIVHQIFKSSFRRNWFHRSFHVIQQFSNLKAPKFATEVTCPRTTPPRAFSQCRQPKRNSPAFESSCQRLFSQITSSVISVLWEAILCTYLHHLTTAIARKYCSPPHSTPFHFQQMPMHSNIRPSLLKYTGIFDQSCNSSTQRSTLGENQSGKLRPPLHRFPHCPGDIPESQNCTNITSQLIQRICASVPQYSGYM